MVSRKSFFSYGTKATFGKGIKKLLRTNLPGFNRKEFWGACWRQFYIAVSCKAGTRLLCTGSPALPFDGGPRLNGGAVI